MSALGMDPARSRFVSGRLLQEVADLQRVRESLGAVYQLSDSYSLLTEARRLETEFGQETSIVAEILSLTADLVEAADNNAPQPVLSTIHGLIDAKLSALGISLGDGVGAMGSPAEIRAALERRLLGPNGACPATGYETWFANDYAATMISGANALELRAFWDSLSPYERSLLIEQRPDLVVFQVMASGVALSDDDLEALDRSNSFGMLDASLFMDIDASVNLAVVTIDVGAGISVAVTQMSDGSVRVVIVGNVSGGVSREVDAEFGEVSVGLAAVLESSQVLKFDSPQQAAQAITDLKNAVAEDLNITWGDVPGVVRGGVGTVVKYTSPLAWFTPIDDWIAGDQRPESLKALEQIFETYGLTTTLAVGVKADASVGFDLGDIQAEGSVEASFMLYNTSANGGSDAVGQNGAVMAGQIAFEFQSGAGGPTLPGLPVAEGSYTGEAGFVQDFYIDANGNAFSETTLYIEQGVGTVGELGFGDVVLDKSGSPTGSAIEVSSTTEATVRYTYKVKLPVNAETTGAIADLATSLVNGQLPIDALGDLYDVAEISITQQAGVSTTAKVEANGGPVEVTVNLGTSANVTTIDIHKNPGGDMYDRIEANDIIDVALNGS